MKHWWVNQNQTYSHEVNGGYLWSPQRRADGFSFTDTLIKAIGIVSGHHQAAGFGSAGANWSSAATEIAAQVHAKGYNGRNASSKLARNWGRDTPLPGVSWM